MFHLSLGHFTVTLTEEQVASVLVDITINHLEPMRQVNTCMRVGPIIV